MRHLNLTDLARVVDEAPTAEEAEHLNDCGGCRSELESLRRQTEALAELSDLPVPVAVNQRVRDAVLFQAARRRRRKVPPFVLRAAAGVVLFVGGAGFGARVLANPTAAEVRAPGAFGTTAPATLAEAAAAVSRAEAEYLHALTRYAELSETGEGLDPVSRLAALEGIVLTTRAALREAPADPIINNYHLTAISQRDALLRQIEILAGEDTWY